MIMSYQYKLQSYDIIITSYTTTKLKSQMTKLLTITMTNPTCPQAILPRNYCVCGSDATMLFPITVSSPAECHSYQETQLSNQPHSSLPKVR